MAASLVKKGKRMRIWLLSSILVLAAQASSLKYFADEVQYTPDNFMGFVGFSPQARVECDGRELPLAASAQMPQGCALCEAYATLQTVNERLIAVQAERQLLDAMQAKSSYENVRAEQLLEDARMTARRKAALTYEIDALMMERKAAEAQFRQAGLGSSVKPHYTPQSCVHPTITLPSHLLQIRSSNVAKIEGDKITVTDVLRFRNRSGVDIAADTGIFYTYPLHDSMPMHDFSPWVIREARPAPIKRSFAGMAKDRVMAEEVMPMVAPKPEMTASVSEVSRLSDKRYALKQLILPADGSEIRADVAAWDAAVQADLIVWPYRDTRVFVTYTFEPKARIQDSTWEVHDGEMTQRERFGRYEKQRYRLFAYIDRDVTVTRKRLLHKNKDGFFSGPKTDDGYELELTNLSNRVKTVHIVERIPVSTTDKISVKEVTISPRALDMKLDAKEGRIDSWLTLEPNESRKVTVKFTVSHDSDVKPQY